MGNRSFLKGLVTGGALGLVWSSMKKPQHNLASQVAESSARVRRTAQRATREVSEGVSRWLKK